MNKWINEWKDEWTHAHTWFAIRAAVFWDRACYLSVTKSPHNTKSLWVGGEETFFVLEPQYQSWRRTRKLRHDRHPSLWQVICVLAYKMPCQIDQPMPQYGSTWRVCLAFKYDRIFLPSESCHPINPFKPEFTIVIFIHNKPWIAVAILDL